MTITTAAPEATDLGVQLRGYAAAVRTGAPESVLDRYRGRLDAIAATYLTSAKPARQLFPLDGFADTCIGFGVDMHGADDTDDSLCSSCAARLSGAVANDAPAATPFVCGCADAGHAHGAKYFDCLCCYGD